jgi:glycosyltransferase involved in cell wall biosynthesis
MLNTDSKDRLRVDPAIAPSQSVAAAKPGADARKKISIVTPCYNEEANVEMLYGKVQEMLRQLPAYDYEHIFIDNASHDRTVEVLKGMAARDPNVKVIVNTRNFGHLRSPHHAILQATGDCVIIIAADLQDPPALILDFVRKWEEGFKVVLGVRTQTEESAVMFFIRSSYYTFVNRVSDIELVKNSAGFGLYDRRVVEVVRRIDDPYPYFRGLISDIGFQSAKIEYTQASRKRGITKNNFYTLYDMAMLGITNHSRIPLRIATFAGFVLSLVSALVAVVYFVLKLMFWYRFDAGLAPILVGVFFFSSVQLFFTGVLGEYIGAIYTQIQKRPYVVERERINFDTDV